MFRSIKCRLKDMGSQCHKEFYVETAQEIELLFSQRDKANSHYNDCIRRVHQCSTIEEIIDVKLDIQERSLSVKSSNISYKECSLNPSGCDHDIREIDNQSRKMKKEIREIENKLSDLREVIEQLNEFYEKNNKSSNIYYRFF
ncbi:hypothetical protein [Cohnella rhizosphaerae]|uniref:Uncharacterized protein n=1 Tax=Cohnella rhizosphaerae TaxID=1457232 RepID=A0A9X4QTE4_9BACL|nr:hypothetical protein [Cohnella rhizosphaerae]MDG0810610.1 hypothetical protein [Cohnella rhizosphaerae]